VQVTAQQLLSLHPGFERAMKQLPVVHVVVQLTESVPATSSPPSAEIRMK
jgi:hypothetical protein